MKKFTTKELQQLFLKGEVKQDRFSFRSTRPVITRDINQVAIGNKKSVEILMNGDEDRAEFLTEVKLGEDHPAFPWPDTEVVLTEQWAKSFAKSINASPKPLYSKGHEDAGAHSKMRVPSAGYVIGAKVDNSILLLRNYLRQGLTEDQSAQREQDMTELKAGILSTSTGDMTEYKINFDKETNKYTYKAIKSLGSQSNAIVEAHLTGAEATVPQTTFKSSDAENENKNHRRTNMEDQLTSLQMFTSLKNQFTTGSISITDIEAGLGVTILKAEDKGKIDSYNKAEQLAGGDVITFIERAQSAEENAFIALRDSSLASKFEDKDIREIAALQFNLKAGSKEEIEAHVEEISQLKAITSIAERTAASVNTQHGGSESPAAENNDSQIADV